MPPTTPASQFEESSMSMSNPKYYISNTKLSSVPLNSRLNAPDTDQSDDYQKSIAIINNRNTQFSTLQLPSSVEEAIKKERRVL